MAKSKTYTELEVQMVQVATRLEGHEKTCTERYDQIHDTLTDHNNKFNNIFWTILTTAGSIIATLGTALGYIAFHIK